jgi:hypothetical protein
MLTFLNVPQNVFALDFHEQFDNLDHWTAYHTQQNVKRGTIDTQLGMPPPSLMVPSAGSIVPDPPGFADNVSSLYISNPDTSKLANFTLSFWIHFDDTIGRAGRAIVTFRMQNERNYYAAYLSDDVTWTSRIDKFVDDKEIILKETENRGVFDPNTWSNVKLQVRGTTFSLYKDGSLILTGSDNDWSSGKTYGIGIYNGYHTYSFHIDDLLLETCEPLCYVNVVTVNSTSTIKQTTEVTSTETSTEISTVLGTTTTTSISQITQIELVTNTSFITTSVGVLTPVLDWPSSLILFIAGAVFAYVGDVKKYRPMYEVAAAVLVIIIATYYVATRELSSLGALIAGVLIGVLVRLVSKK